MAQVIQGRAAYSTPLKLDKALAIPGWMSIMELAWLAEQATKHSRIVEIGSYLGRSTRALADNTPGWVLAVDDWKGPRDAQHDKDLFKKFNENMMDECYDESFVPSENVRTLQCDHESVEPSQIEGNTNGFDMIFLDGSHEYEDVKRDIGKWLPFLEKGGLICGHDFSDEYPSVQQAVKESFSSFAAFDTIWFKDFKVA